MSEQKKKCEEVESLALISMQTKLELPPIIEKKQAIVLIRDSNII